MKKILFLLLLSLFVGSSLHGQRFLGAVIAGGNLTQVDGDEVYGFYNLGINAGAAVSVPLEKKQRWLLTVELLYTQKGALKKCSAGYFDTLVYAPSMFEDVDRSVAFNPKKKCDLNLDYVEVPVMVHYEDPHTGWALGAGVSWGRLVRVSETYNGFHRTTSIRSKTFSKNDWSVLGDLRIRLWKGLKLGLRFQYSFVSIRKMNYTTMLQYTNENNEVCRKVKDSWDRNFYNKVISVRLIYVINEKFTKNGKGKWVKDISDTYNTKH